MSMYLIELEKKIFQIKMSSMKKMHYASTKYNFIFIYSNAETQKDTIIIQYF